MKHLIIHPQDESTIFLKPIYAHLKNKTVITGGATKKEIREQIEIHDQVLMLGHGSPMGLLAVDQFPEVKINIIDDSMVNSLRCKTNNIFIWCHADQFVHRNGLSGFYCGMFISEFEEALYFDFWDVDTEWINESNNEFSAIVSKHIQEPVAILYNKLIHGYGLLAPTNPIAKFNHERLYLKYPKPRIIKNTKLKKIKLLPTFNPN
jgi:hypothetical protein